MTQTLVGHCNEIIMTFCPPYCEWLIEAWDFVYILTICSYRWVFSFLLTIKIHVSTKQTNHFSPLLEAFSKFILLLCGVYVSDQTRKISWKVGQQSPKKERVKQVREIYPLILSLLLCLFDLLRTCLNPLIFVFGIDL